MISMMAIDVNLNEMWRNDHDQLKKLVIITITQLNDPESNLLSIFVCAFGMFCIVSCLS